MPRKSNPVPSYRHQRRKGKIGLAFVELGGVRHYLGPHGSPESRENYARLIAEWAATGGQTATEPDQITIGELVSRFWAFSEDYYENTYGTTSEISSYRQALKPLVAIYGKIPARDFGPIGLKTVRQKMIDTGWCRSHINHQISRLRRFFKWGAGEELIEASVFHRLQVVEGLRRGRSKAREPTPVMPVSDHAVDATLAFLTPTVAAMVRVQRLTGMRPGEVVLMRTCDIDVSGSVWVFTPHEHKSEWRGKSRRVMVGPKAQKVLKPWLRTDLQAYLFSPKQADRERREALHANRVTPMSCGNTPGSNQKRRPSKQPGERYVPTSYARSVANACRRAFPAPKGLDGEALKQWHREHKWYPNMLRHSFATLVRREHGLECAQVLLGHSRADVTQVYAERDETLAKASILKIG